MREIHPLVRPGVAARRLAVAWLTLAALLSLCLSQSLHASGGVAVASAGAEAAFAVAANDSTFSHAAHDADLCSLCRATAQARLGVRVSAGIGDLAANGARLLLALPAPKLARSAPDLRDAEPRAPPAHTRLSA